jgi:tetratricopeptide (TPR) repeat protein
MIMMDVERDVLEKGQQLSEKHHYRAAIDLLSQAIEAAPSHKLYFSRGQQHEHLGEFHKAFGDYSAAIQLAPHETMYLESRGVLSCSRLARVADAIADFNKIVELNPISAIPHQRLCLCYLQSGNVDVACDHAERAISLDDSDGYSHYCLGQCRLAEKRFHSAAKEFEIALRLQAGNARFWMGLSAACQGTGDLERAETSCKNGVNLDPSASSYIHLARIQLELGQLQSASKSLESARAFDLTEIERILVDGYTRRAEAKKE